MGRKQIHAEIRGRIVSKGGESSKKVAVQLHKKIKKHQLFLVLSLIGARNYKKKYKIYFLPLPRSLVVTDFC